MDAKILDAFNDLTKALDKVAESLKDKSGSKSDAAKLLQKVDNIDRRVDALTKGLRSLKKDTTQILKNQETLIRLSKEEEKT
jgi:DNA-binding ferritin-like protein